MQSCVNESVSNRILVSPHAHINAHRHTLSSENLLQTHLYRAHLLHKFFTLQTL